ncbi:MAG: T9SS type A sorting domain-containing protein, partial [Bacteroidia bacterium]|nr:T9SS type A sorting domain-containing protein [Bacteroidia bacterium]
RTNWFNIGFVGGNGTTTNINYYSFIDNEIISGIQYYRLKQIDYAGSYEYSKIIVNNSDITISSFKLFQNYPNPFNSSTIINYQVPVKSLVNISLYNIKGERILELVKDVKDKGLYNLELKNNTLPSGIYFVRMTTSTGYIAVIKITQIK